MKKSISLISLLTTLLFMISTFGTAKFNSNIGSEDKFGVPFIFFSAYNEGEILTNKTFNLTALLLDVAICFVIAYAVVFMVKMLKVERKENQNLAH